MYNFGTPAHLKAYIDHIVRMNKTYSFDLSKEQPYQAFGSSKNYDYPFCPWWT
jgi:FMN-dependent NADH-azoreductase